MSYDLKTVKNDYREGRIRIIPYDNGAITAGSYILTKGSAAPNRAIGNALGQGLGIDLNAVFYDAEGNPVALGSEALAMGVADPEGLATHFKLKVGSGTFLSIRGVPKAPEEIMADAIFLLVKKSSERYSIPMGSLYGSLSFPTTWGPESLEKIISLAAGRGITVVPELCFNEPHCAIAHVSLTDPSVRDMDALLFDSGGSTTDVIVCAIPSDPMLPPAVRSIRGLAKAGIALSDLIVDIIVEKVAAALSVTPETVRRSRKMMFEISEEADIAKADLMEGKDIDTALLVADSDGLVVDWGLTAAEYAKLAEPVLDEMVEVAKAAIETARTDSAENLEALGIKPFERVERIIFCGGTSKGQLVRDHVIQGLGLEPDQAVGTGDQLLVAQGLADLADAVLMAEDCVRPVATRASRGFAVECVDDQGKHLASVHLFMGDVIPAVKALEYVVPKRAAPTLITKVLPVFETDHSHRLLPMIGLDPIGELHIPLPEGTKADDVVSITVEVLSTSSLRISATVNGETAEATMDPGF